MAKGRGEHVADHRFADKTEANQRAREVFAILFDQRDAQLILGQHAARQQISTQTHARDSATWIGRRKITNSILRVRSSRKEKRSPIHGRVDRPGMPLRFFDCTS